MKCIFTFTYDDIKLLRTYNETPKERHIIIHKIQL